MRSPPGLDISLGPSMVPLMSSIEKGKGKEEGAEIE